MNFTITELLDKVNEHLEGLGYTRKPEGLYEPMEYILSLGGKRLRPVLMLLAYNLYKDDVSSILDQAAGVEFYHNHTLLHDDLMDEASMRRGKSTVHKLWGNNVAILSGDAMLILAYRYMQKTPDRYLREVMDLFTETTLEVCEGQQYDMEFENRTEVKEDEYIEMIRLKTAVLLAASLKIGAVLADASEEDAKALYDFGMQIGIAFQLQDDLLDVYGDPKVFGKNIGGDIVCNKKTFMLIKTLEKANRMQRAILERWQKVAHVVDPADKIMAVKGIYDDLGIRAICEDRMREHYNSAMESLDRVGVVEERKSELKKLVRALMYREM